MDMPMLGTSVRYCGREGFVSGRAHRDRLIEITLDDGVAPWEKIWLHERQWSILEIVDQ